MPVVREGCGRLRFPTGLPDNWCRSRRSIRTEGKQHMTIRILLAGALFTMASLAAEANSNGNVTFNKDVLPVLQKNCQSCHRTGEIGPMPLLTYEGTRPWAKAIK